MHLERLAQQGLVERARVRQARGRPPDAWTIAREAQPGGRAPHAYQDLGRWLARALRNRRGGLRGVEESGREIGRELAPKDPHRDPDALETTLTSLGFQPTIEHRDADRVTICLGNCPYRDAVRENQPAICALHRGITRGLLDVLESSARLTGFVPHDPDRAGCQIELRGFGEPTAVGKSSERADWSRAGAPVPNSCELRPSAPSPNRRMAPAGRLENAVAREQERRSSPRCRC